MTGKIRPKAGPSGPVAGLREEIERAREEKLSDEQIGQLLVRLRSGDQEVHKALVSGFRWLLYERIDTDQLSRPQAALGRISRLWEGLDDAVRRLASNDVTNVEKHIRDELYRSRIDQSKEDSMNVYVPSSTNSSRKKKKQKLHDPILHDGDIDVSDEVRDDERFQLLDLIDEYTVNQLESDVLSLLVEGYTYVKIAATLGITKSCVETLVIKIRERAKRKGKGC